MRDAEIFWRILNLLNKSFVLLACAGSLGVGWGGGLRLISTRRTKDIIYSIGTSFFSSLQKTCEESKSGQKDGRKEDIKRQRAMEWRENEEGRLCYEYIYEGSKVKTRPIGDLR